MCIAMRGVVMGSLFLRRLVCAALVERNNSIYVDHAYVYNMNILLPDLVSKCHGGAHFQIPASTSTLDWLDPNLDRKTGSK